MAAIWILTNEEREYRLNLREDVRRAEGDLRTAQIALEEYEQGIKAKRPPLDTE